MTDVLLPFIKLLVTLKLIEYAIAGVAIVGLVLTFLVLGARSLFKNKSKNIKQKYCK